MPGVSQRFIQPPEASDKSLRILRNWLGEVSALRGYCADNRYGSGRSIQRLHHARPLIERRKAGCQVCRESFFRRHLFQTSGQFSQSLRPPGGRVCHNRHVISHIPVVFRQRKPCINRSLAGRHRHVGRIGDQRRPVHQLVACSRVHQLGEFFQNLRHLVATLATADVHDNIRVRPLCDLMLGHRLSRSESPRDCRCASFGDREHGVQYSLAGNQWHAGRISVVYRPGHADWPLLRHGQFLPAAIQ